MTYSKALAASPRLRVYSQTGLKALGSSDRARVSASNSRSIRGSIYVEGCQRQFSANQNTCDYGVGFKLTETGDGMVWVEVHSADSAHVQIILDKFGSLLAFLAEHAPDLSQLPRVFVWLATGTVYLPPNSAGRRRINASGIVLKSGRLALDGLLRDL